MWDILCGSWMVLFSQLSFEYSVQIVSVFAKHKTNNSYLYQCCLVQMWFMFCIQWSKLCKILYFPSNLHVICRWTSPRSWGSQENNRITEALIVLPGHLFLEMDVLLIKESKKPLWNMPNQLVVVWM